MSNTTKNFIPFIDQAYEIEVKINPTVTKSWIMAHRCPYDYGFMLEPEESQCRRENRDCLECWRLNVYG